MRKLFLCIILSLLLLIPVVYGGFWYFAIWKAKNLLVKVISNITNEKLDISYDISGFPSNLIFHVKNPKFSNNQLTISSNSLLIKNRLLDKSLYIYIPSNEINIVVHDDKKINLTCNTNDKNHFIVKLNDLPLSSHLDKVYTIIDYVNTFIYKDYGLKCDVSSDLKDQESFITEVSSGGNYVQFNSSKKPNENLKLGFDFYIYRYKNIINPESYSSIDIKVNYELISDISASNINFDIEKFLIQMNNFSLTANGRIHNYNLVTSSFKDKINVKISNYKELIFGKGFTEKFLHAFWQLMFFLSEKTVNDDIQFTIKYDDDIGSSFIGKLSTTDFINRLNKLAKDEDSN